MEPVRVSAGECLPCCCCAGSTEPGGCSRPAVDGALVRGPDGRADPTALLWADVDAAFGLVGLLLVAVEEVLAKWC